MTVQERVDEINRQVKGFLIPIFVMDPISGMNLAGLRASDVDKVRTGYACANADCLAEFYHYTIRCPVCGYTRDVNRDVAEAPAFWQEHLEERDYGTQHELPKNPFTDPKAADEMIERVRRDKDIEQIKN